MKILTSLFHRLFDKNFDEKIKKAKMTKWMIDCSTSGNFAQFYNVQGEKIRGFSNPRPGRQHPLISKYGS